MKSRILMAVLVPALAFVLWPGLAEASVLLSEKLRPNAGQPSEFILSGSYMGFLPKTVEAVEVTSEVEDGESMEVVVLSFAGEVLDSPGEIPFAIPFEMPALTQVGSHTLQIYLRQEMTLDIFQLKDEIFFVHYPLSYQIERVDEDVENTFRLRISGSSALASAQLAGSPEVEGNTIKVPISIGCDLDCAFDPAPIEPWELLTEVIGPLAGGTYELEISTITSRGEEAKIALRDEIFIADEAIVRDGRFGIRITLDPPLTEKPRLVGPPTTDSALFYFFSPNNWEVMVKVLDGCALNGHFWVFAAASTDVGYTLEVTERVPGGRTAEYRHEAGTPAPAITDTSAFSCD